LPEEPARPGPRRFYRRIKDNQWQDESRQMPQDTAFHRGKDEDGLSVFDAAVATPRDVLEDQINIWREIAQDPIKSEKDHRWANRKLEQCDNSVEGLLSQGWGVAEITESLFWRCGFEPSAKIDPNGHLEILGTKAAFEEQSLEIIDDPDCRVLSDEECTH
jgi:hypothetical protein